ncbi:hypothetical protein [Spirosoma harenae]
MKTTKATNAVQPKRVYTTPNLIKHGSVAQITLKGGSAFDVMNTSNDFQP